MDTAAATPAQTPAMTPEVMIDKYLRLRAKKDEITKRQKDELAPYNNALESLENLLLSTLNDGGVESMRAKSGTAYKTTRTSITVSEWQKTLEFIKNNDAFELLEARVNKTAADDYMKENDGEPVPGTVVRREIAVNVRRST